jgi:TRAP-type C4-dicarboxylate transport system permease small subunit
MISLIVRLSALLERVLGWVIMALMLIALGIVTGQFIDRHFMDLPWDAPDQFARITVVWLCFIGTGLALVEGSAIRIDLLDHVLPSRVIAWRDTIFDIALLGMLVVLAVTGWAVVKVGATQVLLGTPFTADLPYSALLIGSVAGALFVAARLLRRTVEVFDRTKG